MGLLGRLGVLAVAGALLVSAPTGGAAFAGDLKPFVRGSFGGLVAAHDRSPFIVAFWSTDCVPCLVNLRLWRSLKAERPDIDLVLISTDRREEETRIRRLIDRHELGAAPAWIFADAVAERLYADVDPSWQGELPRTYLFDRKGNSRMVEGLIDKADLISWIEESR